MGEAGADDPGADQRLPQADDELHLRARTVAPRGTRASARATSPWSMTCAPSTSRRTSSTSRRGSGSMRSLFARAGFDVTIADPTPPRCARAVSRRAAGPPPQGVEIRRGAEPDRPEPRRHPRAGRARAPPRDRSSTPWWTSSSSSNTPAPRSSSPAPFGRTAMPDAPRRGRAPKLQVQRLQTELPQQDTFITDSESSVAGGAERARGCRPAASAGRRRRASAGGRQAGDRAACGCRARRRAPR